MIKVKKAIIIYNPTSGNETFKKHLPYALEKIASAGYEVLAHATTCAGNATEAAKEAAENDCDLVIAAGGDGTIHEVLNGIAGLKKRPTLGVIPVGTTNDFGRAIRVGGSIERAIDVIAAGHKVPLDIGKFNDTYFIYVACAGVLTPLSYETSSSLKTKFGKLAYVAKGVELLPTIKATRMRIEHDNGVFDDEAMCFFVANTNSVAGFEKLAPDAELYDGEFVVLIVKKVSLLQIGILMKDVQIGKHIDNPHIEYIKSKRLKVTCEDDLLINLDGERGGKAIGELVNLNRHIEIIVPAEMEEKFNLEYK